MRRYAWLIAAAVAGYAPAAHASDDIFELWMNPSVEADIGRGRAELETAHRIRDGREDTHYVRLWYGQPIADHVTLAGGVEQRFTGSVEERRLLQQLSYRSGILRGRTRIEQRFVEGDAKMGVRLRQRLGMSVPVGHAGRLALVANAEGFITLRATTALGQTGLTGLRTVIGVDYAVSDRIGIGLGYLRAHEFRRGAADRVGHAPLLSIAWSI